jgi:hydroxymethylpyrimidine/phosphomethylpyrimidine kinase
MGVRKSFNLPLEIIEDQWNTVVEDMNVVAIKTGMLSTPEIISLVSEKISELISEKDIPVVVDPVMKAETGSSLVEERAIDNLKKQLLPLATAVTPNRFEAEKLSGKMIKDIDDAEQVARLIHSMGPKNVAITGGHLNGVDILFDGSTVETAKSELLNVKSHGSGCSYASALVCSLASGLDFFSAAKKAKNFVYWAIMTSEPVGKGVVPVNQIGVIERDRERFYVLNSLNRCVKKFTSLKGFELLIPEVGTNFGYAIPFPISTKDVAAVKGRIHTTGACGSVDFGSSGHIARLILSANKFDPSIRSAMNIRFGEEIVEEALKARMNVVEVNREKEKEEKEGTTMDWIIREAYIEAGVIPDIVYDRGAVGKEAMMRVFGRTAEDVLAKIETILQGLT